MLEAVMGLLPRVDALFDAFCEELPAPLREEARGLTQTLGLTSVQNAPWSGVFSHEVTLAAPALFVDAMPDVAPRNVDDALRAHLLSIVDAVGTDRIEDGQVTPTPNLQSVLVAARAGRDAALRRIVPVAGDAGLDDGASGGRLAPAAPRPELDPAAYDRAFLGAIRRERALLLEDGVADFAGYRALSIEKQAFGILPSLALARAAGWSAKRRASVALALRDVWLGLQFYDDVVDWQADAALGGAWAVALARGVLGREMPPASLGVDALRPFVQRAQILPEMLDASRRAFVGAERRTRALGAPRLTAWARERAGFVRGLADGERACAGFVERVHALGPWAKIVLV